MLHLINKQDENVNEMTEWKLTFTLDTFSSSHHSCRLFGLPVSALKAGYVFTAHTIRLQGRIWN